MPGLEETPGARPSASCCTPVLHPLQGCQASDWWGAPQPCDRHQAHSASGPDRKRLQQPQWWPEVVTAHADFAWPQCREQECDRVSLPPPLQGRGPSPPCSSPCSDVDTSQRANTVTSTRYFRKSKTSRETFPLVKSLSFQAGWCEMLSCGSSWVKEQMILTCYCVSASEALQGLKWQVIGAKQDREMNDQNQLSLAFWKHVEMYFTLLGSAKFSNCKSALQFICWSK